jgi:hypothetical protein
MYKLIISNTRYDAIIDASHLLDGRSVVITISDGAEESNVYGLCLRALTEQRKFEVEKAYKLFDIRQLYCFNQNLNNVDYQFVLVKLQLMLTVTPFTHICYSETDKQLLDIYEGLIGDRSRIIYLKEPTNKSLIYKLSDEEIGRKLEAIEKMTTIRTKLLYKNQFENEYLKRIV